jgi:hypothetical protein
MERAGVDRQLPGGMIASSYEETVAGKGPTEKPWQGRPRFLASLLWAEHPHWIGPADGRGLRERGMQGILSSWFNGFFGG